MDEIVRQTMFELSDMGDLPQLKNWVDNNYSDLSRKDFFQVFLASYLLQKEQLETLTTKIEHLTKEIHQLKNKLDTSL